MKHATFRQLMVFETVARHLSFSRAAEALHLTQPAVSIQVKKLEEQAGHALFEQMGKKIFLTPAGNEMLHASRSIMKQFQDLQSGMVQLQGISGGRLNVSVISAGDYFLPRLLVAFAKQHKGVSLNLEVYNRRELLTQLADNLTDLAVMGRPPIDADVVRQPFAPHPYVIVAAPDHPLVGRKRIPVKRLMRESFVVREKGSDTWNAMEEGLHGHFDELKIVMQTKSVETIKQAVIAGMGISFLSAHTLTLELQTARLVLLDVQGFPLMQNWYVVHRTGKRLPPVAQAFKNFLLAEGAQRVEALTAGTLSENALT
jgi:LysR family transcriptional regulator, low CO2-responsive transcriptional regulator